jgi:hypothetical protein
MSTGTIDLQSHAGAGLTEVGTDLFRLAEASAAIPGQLSFNWSYSDGNPPVTSSNCTVIAEVSGGRTVLHLRTADSARRRRPHGRDENSHRRGRLGRARMRTSSAN